MTPATPDALAWPLFALAFLAGGLVKGALGVGLPLVAVPLLTLGMPVPTAIGVLIAPVLISNAVQMAEGRGLRAHLRRFGGLVVVHVACIVLMVRVTLVLSPRQLGLLVAAAVLLAVALMALRPDLQISRRDERWLGYVAGAASGVLGALSLSGPILMTYLMGLRLARDEFVGAISVIYLAGALALYGSLAIYGRIGRTELALSLLALLPMATGLLVGRAWRRHLSERRFRGILLAFLGGLAVLQLFRN